MRLPVNQFDHFYRGGDRIGALRHGPGGPQRPEEWIGSTTARFGQAPQATAEPGGAERQDRGADREPGGGNLPRRSVLLDERRTILLDPGLPFLAAVGQFRHARENRYARTGRLDG